MPRWDNKFVCQSYFINKTLEQVNDYENNNRERGKNHKFSRKVPEENAGAIQIISSSLKTLSMIR